MNVRLPFWLPNIPMTKHSTSTELEWLEHKENARQNFAMKPKQIWKFRTNIKRIEWCGSAEPE